MRQLADTKKRARPRFQSPYSYESLTSSSLSQYPDSLFSVFSLIHQRLYAVLFLVFAPTPATGGRHGRRSPCHLAGPCAGRTISLGLDVRSANVAMSRYAACCLFRILNFPIVANVPVRFSFSAMRPVPIARTAWPFP
jgi:hypothetical protein